MNIQPIAGIKAVESLSSATWPTLIPSKPLPRKKLSSQGARPFPQSHYCSSYAVEFQATHPQLAKDSRLKAYPVPRNSISTLPNPDGTGFIENHLPFVSLDRQPDPFKPVRYRTVYNDDFKSSSSPTYYNKAKESEVAAVSTSGFSTSSTLNPTKKLLYAPKEFLGYDEINIKPLAKLCLKLPTIQVKGGSVSTPFVTDFESVQMQESLKSPSSHTSSHISGSHDATKPVGGIMALKKPSPIRPTSGAVKTGISAVQQSSGFATSQGDYNVLKHQEDTSGPMKPEESLEKLRKTNLAEYIYKTNPANVISVTHASFPDSACHNRKNRKVSFGNLKEATGSVRNTYATFLYHSDFKAPVLSETHLRYARPSFSGDKGAKISAVLTNANYNHFPLLT